MQLLNSCHVWIFSWMLRRTFSYMLILQNLQSFWWTYTFMSNHVLYLSVHVTVTLFCVRFHPRLFPFVLSCLITWSMAEPVAQLCRPVSVGLKGLNTVKHPSNALTTQASPLCDPQPALWQTHSHPGTLLQRNVMGFCGMCVSGFFGEAL